jgi:tRNA/rRNA methyltransferase
LQVRFPISRSSSLDPLSLFSVAVVEPEFGINVGHLARAMANFGISRLFIISPIKNPIDRNQAMKFSSHGRRVIEEMVYLKSFDDLRKRFQILVGSTAIRAKRKSNLTRKTYALEDSIPIISESLLQRLISSPNSTKSRNSKAICLVFGRDTTGLTNEELRKCDYNITIVTGTEYNTLNISHAAAIIFSAFRSFFRAHSLDKGIKMVEEREPSRAEKQRVIILFEQLAAESDFQDHKREKLNETLNRILNRGNPSLRELYLLMGLANKAKTKIRLLSSQTRQNAFNSR